MATILIADDRPMNRLYLVTLLGYYGHRLLEASNGEEAWQLAQSDRPDLVITDLLMPVLDGQELTERLRADPELAKVPVLFYSAAYSMLQARVVAEKVGAFDVLPKPGDAPTVVAKVHEALGITATSLDSLPASPGRGVTSLTDELADLELTSQKLATPIAMSLEFAAEHDPSQLLAGLGRMARELIGAKYAAIGLPSDSRTTARVVLSSGSDRLPVTCVPKAPMADLGRDSILGAVLTDARTVQLRDVDPALVCLPLAGLLSNVLAVPFIWGGVTRGWLLVADKLGGQDFTDGDASVVSTLATHGASAYSKAEERLDRENELRKSQATFQALFEAAPDAMLTSDRNGTIRTANTRTETMFGYSPNELVGRPIETLMPERFQIKHRGLRYEYYRLPSLRPMGLDFELSGTRKDGSEFPIDIMLSPLETADGKLVLSVIRDITRRKENEAKILDLNRQLEERVKELQALNTSLEAFSYSVSHDLRVPLRAIDGFSRILSETYAGVLDDDADRMLNVIAVKCHQMGELIDDLLAFSRIGRCPILHSEMDMTELARSAVEEMRSAEPSRQIEVMIGELPTAIGDRNLVRQVFVNLVSNAWKFTRHATSPHVEIGSYEDGCAQVYFVKDNGIGFDSRYANKLFGVFQRLHSRDEFEGTGIGLALVKGIVERHGGKAWAAGRVGAGAEFYFTLGPVATSPIPV